MSSTTIQGRLNIARRPIGLVLALMIGFAGTSFSAALAGTPNPGTDASTEDVRVEFVTTSTQDIAIRIEGIDRARLQVLDPERLNACLSVFVRNGDNVSKTPLFGEVRMHDERLEFLPRFAFRRGTDFRVKLCAALGGSSHDLSLPALDQPRSKSQVDAVYPTRDSVPENLLKFYVQFSQPMSRGEVYRHTRILNAKGQVVELAFLEIDEELWDPNHTRVTLLFDPGRIKRELRPREEIGSPLREGSDYTLVIDKAWKDAAGNELERGFQKKFRVVAHDETCPDPERWQLQLPPSQSREPLVVTFDEPLDRAMLEHDLMVIDADDQPVEGTIRVAKHETKWSFVPNHDWAPGEYRLRIATRLEDLAGNSIRKPFEVDLTQPFQSKYPTEFFERPFQVTRDANLP